MSNAAYWNRVSRMTRYQRQSEMLGAILRPNFPAMFENVVAEDQPLPTAVGIFDGIPTPVVPTDSEGTP